MTAEPSDWHLARVVMDLDASREASVRAQEAREGWVRSLRAAKAAGWSWGALSEATGIDRGSLCRLVRRSGK